MLCADEDETKPATERLLRPAFGVYRMEWPGDSGVEFHPLARRVDPAPPRLGLEIEDLIEFARPSATTRYQFVTMDWARKWPTEEVWKVRKK